MIRDFFQHRTGFHLEFCREVCDHDDGELSISLLSKTDAGILVPHNDTTSDTSVPVKILFSGSFSVLAIRSWLFKSMFGFDVKNNYRYLARTRRLKSIVN